MDEARDISANTRVRVQCSDGTVVADEDTVRSCILLADALDASDSKSMHVSAVDVPTQTLERIFGIAEAVNTAPTDVPAYISSHVSTLPPEVVADMLVAADFLNAPTVLSIILEHHYAAAFHGRTYRAALTCLGTPLSTEDERWIERHHPAALGRARTTHSAR